MSEVFYVDLAGELPPEIIEIIGRLTVLFGRLEHAVLIALKRIRGISLSEARKEYKGMSLGAKITGTSTCKDAEAVCRYRKSPPGLKSFSGDYEDLDKLCDKIISLTQNRNDIMHGLIGKVMKKSYTAPDPYLIARDKALKMEKDSLEELEINLVWTIGGLLAIIPIPGLDAEISTGGDVDMIYQVSAVNSDDPIAEEASPVL